MLRRHPTSTRFPYPTLFRSHCQLPTQLRERQLLPRHTGDLFLLEFCREEAPPIRPPPMRFHPTTLLREVKLPFPKRSEEHTSELQSLTNLVCRLLLEKKNK